MALDLTPLVRRRFVNLAERTDTWGDRSESLQRGVLARLTARLARTEYGKTHGIDRLGHGARLPREFADAVPLVEYEELRPWVMRMIRGEKDVLWPGRCRDFAQSSGTSGGRSKFIPITGDSLQGNHYRGGEDTVAHYLRLVPDSRMFAGKGFILGGSFANTLGIDRPGIRIGDLSATLINRINPLANLVRIPSKRVALMADWEQKLPALVRASAWQNVTNISGVPSWFMTVLREVMKLRGASTIAEVWPNLEVFFHGGISFEPYRDEYRRMTAGLDMHFLETYNASEGFFAVQNDFDDSGMLLIVDRDIYYEFLPAEGDDKRPRPLWEVNCGELYELVITSSNGLVRYRLGDTVRVTSVNPVKITVAGRTRSFINAFGEELMDDNAERAVAAACDATGAVIANYTAAPMFSTDGRKGRHQWLVEWSRTPADPALFANTLDTELRRLNSDYDAKRSHSIFLDAPLITDARPGLFDDWLRTAGNHKLGGQRKVPRLCNDRKLMDRLLDLNAK